MTVAEIVGLALYAVLVAHPIAWHVAHAVVDR